jgi:hypothetical protein
VADGRWRAEAQGRCGGVRSVSGAVRGVCPFFVQKRKGAVSCHVLCEARGVCRFFRPKVQSCHVLVRSARVKWFRVNAFTSSTLSLECAHSRRIKKPTQSKPREGRLTARSRATLRASQWHLPRIGHCMHHASRASAVRVVKVSRRLPWRQGKRTRARRR